MIVNAPKLHHWNQTSWHISWRLGSSDLEDGIPRSIWNTARISTSATSLSMSTLHAMFIGWEMMWHSRNASYLELSWASGGRHLTPGQHSMSFRDKKQPCSCPSLFRTLCAKPMELQTPFRALTFSFGIAAGLGFAPRIVSLHRLW